MLFKITPSSGLDNSYYDIKFNIILDSDIPDEEFQLQIINNQIKTQLNILAISNGYIDEKGIAHCKSKQIEGYFDLFNDDKMNAKLESFTSIELECNIVFKEKTFKKTILFFNESFSMDSAVLPFILSLNSSEIDLSKDRELRISIEADAEKSLHFIIESVDCLHSYDFYIFTKPGKTTIGIPVEVLSYELNLYRSATKVFRICYMKPHGITYTNVVNKKKIPISNSEISFSGKLEVVSQKKTDPLGVELNEDFILSDRYFVPTHKDYSYFSKIKTDPVKSFYTKLLKNEIINIRKNKTIENKSDNSEKSIKDNSKTEIGFYNLLGAIYNKVSVLPEKGTKDISVSITNHECADCSRKKKLGVINE